VVDAGGRAGGAQPVLVDLVGDAVHNMRSALDYLACGLVTTNGGRVTSQTQFPIYGSKKAFDKGAPRRVAGMATCPASMIETLQPYYSPTPDEHPLAILAFLSNQDKHRALHVAHWVTERIRQQVSVVGARPDVELVHAHSGPVKDGVEIARFRLASPSARQAVVNAQIETYMRIEGRWRPRRLKGLLNYAEGDVVTRLVPFL
jgi:hypothetical protein